MDEICKALATKIYAASKGGYSIFYEDELFDEMPNEADRNRETLEAALKKLVKGGFIDVKYARGNAFCMAALKPYERVINVPVTENVQEYVPVNLRRVSFYCALGGFIGGVFGGMVCTLLTAIFM